MRLQKKTVAEIKLTYEDGTHETFYPSQPGAAYYQEYLTYAPDGNGKANQVLLDCHEVYWVIRHNGKTAGDFIKEGLDAEHS